MFILDFGSGNTCKNDEDYIVRMIDELIEVDKTPESRRPVIKWQLFKKAGENVPMTRDAFEFAYKYALRAGYKTTASVFDEESLKLLLEYDVPFIKIANQTELYQLLKKIPRGVPAAVSYNPMSGVGPTEYMNSIGDFLLACISKYPADVVSYEAVFSVGSLTSGISDHTLDWRLYEKYRPWNYECHYKLDDSTGLDAGLFARTPKQLSEVLI